MRECALGFAELGLKTRICVQGSMGEGVFMGVPRVLSGVRKVLAMMDWQVMRRATIHVTACNHTEIGHDGLTGGEG